MVTQLTYEEFKSTTTTKMVNVTNSAEPRVDIWPYIEQLKKNNLVLDYVYDNRLVEAVYRNDENTFDHILLPTENKNYFIIVVVDLIQSTIKGHFRMDLEKEYGIK